MQKLRKIKKEKRHFGKPKDRIECFKSLKDTMVCWPKDAMGNLNNAEDKAFLLSMQTDRTASTAGRDMVTHKKKIKLIKRNEAKLRQEEAEENRRKLS